MLGIRYLNGYAVDLWVGDFQGFLADYPLKVEASAFSHEFLFEHLAACIKKGKRHLSLAVDPRISPKDLLMALKAAIAKHPSQNPFKSRATLVLEDEAQYQRYRSLLGEVFPEE